MIVFLLEKRNPRVISQDRTNVKQTTRRDMLKVFTKP
jgi:hypothetical protein